MVLLYSPFHSPLYSFPFFIHAWYADNASACGKISDLYLWWDQLSEFGPHYGYFPNASKTWLVVKDCYLDYVRSLFADTCVNVTSHLGAAVGSSTLLLNMFQAKSPTGFRNYNYFPHLLPPNHMQLMLHLLMDSLASGCSLLELFLILTIFFKHLKTALETFLILLRQAIYHLGILKEICWLCQPELVVWVLSIQSKYVHLSSLPQRRLPCRYSPFCCLRPMLIPSVFMIHNLLSSHWDIHRAKSSRILSTRHTLIDSANATLKRSIELAPEERASSWLTVHPLEEYNFSPCFSWCCGT